MLQFNPLQKVVIPFNLQSNDTNVYYVQAVIRYSVSGAIYQTVNLTDKGGQRFELSFTTPAEGGTGTLIDITYSVYTDSGYTTLSSLYQTVNTQYLIATLFSKAFGYGGGGGATLTKEEVRKIFREEILGINADKDNKETLNFNRNVSKNIGSIQNSLAEIHLKHDKLNGGLMIMSDANKSFQSAGNERIIKFLNEILNQLQNSLKFLSAQLNKHLEDKIARLAVAMDNKINDVHDDLLNKHQTNLTEHLGKHSKEIKKELKTYFAELIKNKNKLRRRDIKRFSEEFNQHLTNLIEDGGFSSELAEEKKINPLEMAKKMLGDRI